MRDWRVLAGLMGCVAGCEVAVCASGVCFEQGGRQTSWGVLPERLRWVDVDGDGMKDLVAASSVGTVTVVWGADATLGGVATTWSVATEVAGLAVVDVDGDGLMDVVTAVPADDEVAVLRGDGQRGLVEQRLAAGDEPRGVIAVELDGDVGVELVTVNVGDGTVSVVGGATTVVGAEPRDVAAGDLDGDGDVDLAVALAGSAGVQVLLGDGEGGLMPGMLHAVGAAPHAVVVADLDDDGALDLATADTLANTVSVVFGDGAGWVARQVEWEVDAEPRGLVVVARDGGGAALAVLSAGTGSVQALEAVSGERVAGAAVGVRVTGIAAGDVDGEQGEEIIYADGRQIGAFNYGAGVQASRLWSGGLGGDAVFGADVDGDGIDEVFVARQAEVVGSGVAAVHFKMLRAGESVWTEQLDLFDAVQAVGAADFNDDGLRDVFVASRRRAVLLTQQADGTMRAGPVSSLGEVSAWAVGDSDADGVGDALVAGDQVLTRLVAGVDGELVSVEVGGVPAQLSHIIEVHDGAGDRLVVASSSGIWVSDAVAGWRKIQLGTIDTFITDVVVAELDGRAGIDAMVCTYSGLMFVADLTADGPRTPLRLGVDKYDALAATDLNEDGALEVVTLLRFDGFVTATPWFFNAEEWSAWASQSIASGGFPRFAQLDGDGVVDVVTGDDASLVTAWRLALGAALRDVGLRRFGTERADIGDVNGDGAPDVVLSGASLAVGLGDGDAGFSPFVHSSREEVLPGIEDVTDAVLVDVDEDGREEVVVAGERLVDWETEVLVVRFGEGGALPAERVATLPRREVKLAAGDFDGDGAVDVMALMRWRSVTLLAGAEGLAVSWDAPAPVEMSDIELFDVDGDGRLDLFGTVNDGIAVARQSEDGTVGPWIPWIDTWMSGDWALGDVDGDRRMDSALAAAGVLTLWRGETARLLLQGVSATELFDVDGDGRLELLAAGRGALQGDGEGRFYWGRGGDGGFSFTSMALAMAEPDALVVRDFDGDARVDVAVVSGARGVTVVRRLQ